MKTPFSASAEFWKENSAATNAASPSTKQRTRLLSKNNNSPAGIWHRRDLYYFSVMVNTLDERMDYMPKDYNKKYSDFSAVDKSRNEIGSLSNVGV